MNLYDFCTGTMQFFLKAFFKVNINGVENIPDSDGIIFVSNHKSNYDAPVISSFLTKKLTFMSKEELFKFKPLGFLLKKIGAFPIKRGSSDIGAMRTAIKILKSEQNMLIFPEGTRCREENKILKGKSGAALLAHKSGAQIVPIGIKGTYKFRAKIDVNIGKPINISDFTDEKPSSQELQKFTDEQVMEKIKILAGAEYYED